MRVSLAIIILILWILLGFGYCFTSKNCCEKPVEAAVSKVEEPVVKAVEFGPLVFNWGDSMAITNDKWPAFKASVLAKLQDNQLLEITGYYSSDEVNNTKYENLGLARAHAIRALFPELPDDRFRLSSKLVDSRTLDKSNPFEAARFDYRVNTEKIKEIDQKTIIYFPFNSTNKLNDAEVETYLNSVVEQLSKTNGKVRLTGHTDDVGSAESNMALGQKRANVIKQYLVSKGLNANRIIAVSKGESDPIASNDTEKGRAQNRRTELEIIN
ncbi:MAG TPA: OmpA family protein [Saprospiraceae bacterium]|nr:OmpA family protein [Saprospiraceae bacterium]MCB9328441.1 OmpA family protein [Lewinellaceae bacterium]HPK10749.1 OmpA family protein [Saprospiraceae bacterium]HRX30044.1 OmpA family protein [Saprospiraceae bacterium]